MKAIIFAAGKGKRMWPLTKHTCKPMLQIHNVPILEYIFYCLPKEIDEAEVVVGYYAKHIQAHFGKEFRGKKIRYISQSKPKGTWDALCKANKYLNKEEKFLVLNADDLHSKLAIKKLCKLKNAILVSKHHNPSKFGVVKFDKDLNLLEIEEKPKKPKTNLVSVGVYVLTHDVFDCQQPEAFNGELFLPKVLNEYLSKVKIKVVKTDFWLPIGSPEEYIAAHQVLG
jgi:NDP-sugar pyrophosphorylase family protein